MNKSEVAKRAAAAFEKIEILDDGVAHILRQLEPSERVATCFRATEGFRRLMEIAIRQKHEDWSEEQVQRETARRWMLLPDD